MGRGGTVKAVYGASGSYTPEAFRQAKLLKRAHGLSVYIRKYAMTKCSLYDIIANITSDMKLGVNSEFFRNRQ